MTLRVLEDEAEFKSLFDLRNYNPPHEGEDFDAEFNSVLGLLRNMLQAQAANAYFIYEAHNNSRFIDVSFQTEGYLDAQLLAQIRTFVCILPNDWMICLWEAYFIFVTKQGIVGYDPLKNDPTFEKAFLDLNRVA